MIFIDDKSIKVSGVVLPGLIKSIEIKDDALIEEQEVEGSTAKAKQVTGYEDAKVTIELTLEDGVDITKEEKLAKIQNLFKKASQSKPTTHEIINQHITARRIKKVIFKSLSTKEENKKQQLSVTLEFWSYNSVSITSSKPKAKKTTAAEVKLDPAYQSYLNNDRGSAPKTDNTPATDSANTSSLSNRLMRMPY